MKRPALFLLCLYSCSAFAERFAAGNSPVFFRNIAKTEMIMTFSQLPLAGKVIDDRYGWSESYWPSNVGGIAYRWNHPNPEPFKYRFLSKEELMRMGREELAQLSPAELYDISRGDYSYTLTRKTLSKYSTRDLWWEGICHGWAQAATNYPEPDSVTIINKDKIKVPFGASDIKALLAMHDAYNYGGSFAFLGRRCKVNGKVPGEGDNRDRVTAPPPEDLANSEECRDVNAGAFHVVISNMIGIHGRGFVADIDRYNDVWNQPIYSFTSKVLGEESVTPFEQSEGISKKLKVNTVMTYGEELKFYTPQLAAEGKRNFVSKLPVTGTVHQEYRSKNYEYIVEMDSAGKVIGGEWISETRPDFMWIYERSKNFKNSPVPLGDLGKIYRPVKR